jgi:hypothetical protein
MVDTAKHEAGELKSTATDAAKDVAGTAKSEAADVARATKNQAAELFHQTQRQLSDQAASQQRRLASGLGAIGDELGSMARNAEGGMAADLVQRVSDRASSAASWLDGRDPAGVLAEVKTFARRRPMVFIGAALVAGLAAGRLTRALISEARDESGESFSSSSGFGAAPTGGATSVGGSGGVGASTGVGATGGVGTAGGPGAAGTVGAAGAAGTWGAGGTPADGSGTGTEGDLGATEAKSPLGDDAPLYSASAARFETDSEEDSDDRSDTV